MAAHQMPTTASGMPHPNAVIPAQYAHAQPQVLQDFASRKMAQKQGNFLFSVVAVVFGVREVGANNTYAFYEGRYSVLTRVFGSPFLSRCSSSSSRCSRSFIISTYRSSSCKFSGNNRFKRSSK